MLARDYTPGIREKVTRLLAILDAVSKHPQFRDNVCLHGGTALNLFAMKAPRMSITERASRNPAALWKIKNLRRSLEMDTGVSKA